jgi:hypothetical protein
MALVVVADGIVAYRRALRRKGGNVAVVLATIVATIGGVLVALPGRPTGVLGFALVVAGCPLLVAFGVPLQSDVATVALGVIASLVAWWGVGTLAAWRATRKPIADWRDWAKQMLPLAAAFVLGGYLGLGVFALGVL